MEETTEQSNELHAYICTFTGMCKRKPSILTKATSEGCEHQMNYVLRIRTCVVSPYNTATSVTCCRHCGQPHNSLGKSYVLTVTSVPVTFPWAQRYVLSPSV